MASIAQRRRERVTAGKEKRKKILAIVGICLLLIVLGIQLPKALDLVKSESPPAPPVAAPTPSTPTTEPKVPPAALKLLRIPSSNDPFAQRTLASGDPAPADVPWPAGARDPFVRAQVATVIAPKRIIVGTPKAGQTPTVGYIVVLASIRTGAGRGVAERIATQARKDGLSPVGVLDSSTSRPLRAGYYVAYAGPYASGSAVRDASDEAHALGYRTAYIRELIRY
jgi:hypothetical protein